MSVRKLIVVLVAVFVVSAAAVFVVLQIPAKTDKPREETDAAGQDAKPYAYTTSEELVVMRGGRTVSRLARVFDASRVEEIFGPQLAWTWNGNYVAVLSDTSARMRPAADTELIYVDTRSGAQRRLPCPNCRSLVSISDADIIARSDTAETTPFRRLNLENNRQVDPIEFLPSDFLLLAGMHDHVLVSRVSGDYVNQELILYSLDGLTSDGYPYIESNHWMLTAVKESDSKEQGVIALVANPDPGTCVSESPIFLFKPGGDYIKTDMSATKPPGDAPWGVDVHDVWWGVDGQLRATIASWSCDESQRTEDEKQKLFSASSVWKLDGQSWVKEDSAPATMVRTLGRNASIVLIIPDCVGPVNQPDYPPDCHTGSLVRQQGEVRTGVAEGVISISTPPTDQP